MKRKCSVDNVAENGGNEAPVHFNRSAVQTHDPATHNMQHVQTYNSAFFCRAKHESDVHRHAEIATGLYNDMVDGNSNLTLTSAEVELDHPFSPTVERHLLDGPFLHPAGVCSWSNMR